MFILWYVIFLVVVQMVILSYRFQLIILSNGMKNTIFYVDIISIKINQFLK